MPRNLNTRKRIYRKDAKVQSRKATTGSIPKGLRHSAKRCHAEGKATLGDESQIEINLERVGTGAPSSRPQPPLGLRTFLGFNPQGSSCLPNLGFASESHWDSRMHFWQGGQSSAGRSSAGQPRRALPDMPRRGGKVDRGIS